jgi:hypothetical protein
VNTNVTMPIMKMCAVIPVHRNLGVRLRRKT